MLCRSCNLLSACFPLPDGESLSPNCTIGIGGHQVSAGMEVTMNKCVGGKEILSLFWRFESLHLPFSTPCRPMRVFRAVVQIPTLTMSNLGKGIVTVTGAGSRVGDQQD